MFGGCSPSSGYVSRIDAREIGLIAMELGAGRQRIDDEIDLSAGLELLVKVGDQLQQGQVMARVYGPAPESVNSAARRIEAAIELIGSPTEPLPLILALIQVSLGITAG